MPAVWKSLGGRFQLNPEGLPAADEQHKDPVHDRFKDVAERLGRFSVGRDVRAADVWAIMPRLAFSALAWNPADFSDARRQRLLVNESTCYQVGKRIHAGAWKYPLRCSVPCTTLASLLHCFMSKC